MAPQRDPRRLEQAVDSELNRRLGAYERQIVANYREALGRIREDISVIYEKYAVDGTLSLADMTRFNRLAKLEKNIVSDMRTYMTANDRILAKIAKTEYEEAFFRYGWSIDQQTGVGIQWGTLNTDAVAEAVANPLNLISRKRLQANTIARVRTAVSQGLIRGVSYPAMMRGVKDSINGSASDAMRIVRTEGQRAQVLGQQDSYERAREKGVDVVDVWDATLDSRTRDDHGSLDGKHRGDDGYFATSVGKVKGPLQSGVAAFDINCRCRIRGEVEGFAPELRRVEGQVKPYQTYAEWRGSLNGRGRAA